MNTDTFDQSLIYLSLHKDCSCAMFYHARVIFSVIIAFKSIISISKTILILYNGKKENKYVFGCFYNLFLSI